MGVTILIWLTNSSEIKLGKALQSNNTVKEKLKYLKGKQINLDEALILIHSISGANISVTGVPKVSFLVQNIMEVDPTGNLLEVDAYIVVEVPDDAVVLACASDLKYRYCYYDPNMGLMGHKDLMVTLGHNIKNVVVVVANIRATKIWKINYFVLSDNNNIALHCTTFARHCMTTSTLHVK